MFNEEQRQVSNPSMSCQLDGCLHSQRYRRGGLKGRCYVHGGVPQCTELGCEAPVRYLPGGVKDKCRRHGGTPKCTLPGCATPVKFKKGGVRDRCALHGGLPQCTYPECESRQKFQGGDRKDRCARHGGYPTCTESGCSALENFRCGGERHKCFKHGGFPMCRSCGVSIVTSIDRLCSYCDPISKRRGRVKSEEQRILLVLEKNDIVFSREHTIDYGCLAGSTETKKRARIDFVLEGPHRRILLEIDEHQHKSGNYSLSCGLSRMMNVMSSIACDNNTRPTTWIRYNPHAFLINKVRHNPSRVTRETQLIAHIRALSNAPKQGLMFEIMYMYYDIIDGLPTVTTDDAYPLELIESVRCFPIL